MKITIIGSGREGGRAGFITQALNTIGQEAVLVDSDSIADRFTGKRYLDIVNRSKPIPLDEIVECDDADAILIIHHALRYHWPRVASITRKPIIAFWHCEPYFRPSITPDLLLAADTNVQGHWLQWWRWEYSHVTRTTLFPFACPDLSWVKPRQINSGLHFLANRCFNAPGMATCSYFERLALRDRNRIVDDCMYGTRAWRPNHSPLTIHDYPMPWRQYIQELSECARVLVVPGGGCQFNQQFSECLALGVQPVVAIEEPEQVAGYSAIGLQSAIHYQQLQYYYPSVGDLNPGDLRAWAAQNSYTARARQLVAEIDKTAEMIENNERFNASIK